MTSDHVIDRIAAALERERSFAGLRARVAAARAAASAEPTETAAVEAVAELFAAELDALAAESERVTGLNALATDVQAACVDALAAVPTGDPRALEAALPVLARATHRGRSLEVRAAAAERCLHAMAEPDAIPADAVPIAAFERAFEAGERDVRVQLAAVRRGVVGHGGVFAAAAEHAPERAPEVVRWLLRFEAFDLVDNRLSFEWGVARTLESLDGEHASRVLDVVLDHLGHGDADRRRTAAGALAESPDAVPDDRVADVLEALGRRFDDDAFGIREDAVAAALALLDRAPGAAERTFDRLRADAPPAAVLDGLRGLEEADPAVRAPAIEFLLDACDGEATERTAARLGDAIAADGSHRWSAVGRALVAGAAVEAADDDADRARASGRLAELAPGVDAADGNRVRALAAVATDVDVDTTRVFVTLVPPPDDVDVALDREACLRDALAACLRAARASDAARRRRARLAAELLADAVEGGDEQPGDAALAVRDALRAVTNPAAATPASVAARTRLVAGGSASGRVLDAATVAGLLAHEDDAVRERAVDLLAVGRVDAGDEGADVVVERFVDRLAADAESVGRAAVDAAPAAVDGLPESAAGRVVDGLLERAASGEERTQRRAIAALGDLANAVPADRDERVATLALLGLQSADAGTRSVAADLLLAVAPRLSGERARAVAAGVVSATEAYADVVFDGLDVLWALADVPGVRESVARAFARTLAASRVARDHLADASVGFEATPAQVRRVVDGLVEVVAAGDGDASAAAATALEVVATMLPADRVTAVVDALATAASGEDAAARSAGFDALESVATDAGDAPPSTWTPLGALLVADGPRVRRGAVRVFTDVLDAAGDPTAAAKRARDLADATAWRDHANSGASDGGILRAVLTERLVDPAAMVRAAATRAVAALAAADASDAAGWTWAVDRLRDRVVDDDARVRRAAVEALRSRPVADDSDAAVDVAPRSVRTALADRVADDPDASVREAAVETLLALDDEPPRAVLEDAAVALRDEDPAVRTAAVEALSAFVERVAPALGVRSRVVVHLGERVDADDAAPVRRAAVEAAGTVLASVVEDHGAYDPDGDRAGEWPPAEWVRAAFERDSEALRDAVLAQLPAIAPALPPRDAGVAARYVAVARRDREAFPADVDRAALTALADQLDPSGLDSVEGHVSRALRDAEGETVDALAVALAAVVEGRKGMADDVLETLLDRVATAPRPTGPFGQRLPSPQADAARAVLVDLVDAFPATFGKRVDPELLRLYVGHERDAVRVGAAAVLAAVVEHGDDPQAAVATRDDLRACLTVDGLPTSARLGVLAALADGALLARTATTNGGE